VKKLRERKLLHPYLQRCKASFSAHQFSTAVGNHQCNFSWVFEPSSRIVWVGSMMHDGIGS
jgi:hypothetical protein